MFELMDRAKLNPNLVQIEAGLKNDRWQENQEEHCGRKTFLRLRQNANFNSSKDRTAHKPNVITI